MLRLHRTRFDDVRYPELAERCRELIWSTAAQVLRTETAVILDWNMWSRARRAEAVRRANELGVACHLHYLHVPIETARARAAARTDPTSHRLTPEGIDHLAQLFEPPSVSEGFILHETFEH